MFLKTCLRLLRALLFVDHCVVCQQEGSLLHRQCIGVFTPAPAHSLAWIQSQWCYRDPAVRRLIHQIKQKPSADILETCIQGISLPYSSTTEILLVPVPASPERMRQYGFNQARMLADALAQKYKNYTVCDILQHTQITKPKQALVKNRTERLANKHDSFFLPKKYYGEIRGKHIVIIDDVSTTGATLIEARRALANAGSASIQAWTLSH